MKADESKPSRPDKFENISDINDTFDITKQNTEKKYGRNKKYEPKSDNNRVFSDYNKKKTIIKGELKPEHDDDKNMTEKTNVKHKKIEKKETMTMPQKKPMKMQIIL